MIFICYPKCTTCQKARAWRPAAEKVFQHQRSAIQIYGAKGQVAPNGRGRDAKAPRHRRHARQASASGER